MSQPHLAASRRQGVQEFADTGCGVARVVCRRHLRSDKISARFGETACLIRRRNIEGDAGHFEECAPPGDEIQPTLGRPLAILNVRRNAERDVVRTGFSELHGVMAHTPGIGADHRSGGRNLPS